MQKSLMYYLNGPLTQPNVSPTLEFNQHESQMKYFSKSSIKKFFRLFYLDSESILLQLLLKCFPPSLLVFDIAQSWFFQWCQNWFCLTNSWPDLWLNHVEKKLIIDAKINQRLSEPFFHKEIITSYKNNEALKRFIKQLFE